MFRGTLEVTADALGVVMEHYDIGEPHVTMRPEPVWRSPDAGAAALADAKAQFARYRLIRADGSMDGGLRASLACSAHPAIEYYGWFQVRGNTTAVLACSLEHEALLAIRDDQRIQLRRCNPAGLAAELLSALPALRPAEFPPLSMRLRDAKGAVNGSGTGSQQARQLAALRSREEMGGGQLRVARRDQDGNRTRSPVALRIVDNPEGRLLNLVTPDGWLLVAPGTPAQLRQRLKQAHDALPASHA